MSQQKHGIKRKDASQADDNEQPAKKVAEPGGSTAPVIPTKFVVVEQYDCPRGLRGRILDKCVLEFLDPDLELKPSGGSSDESTQGNFGPPTNHTILRLVFRNEHKKDGAYVRGGTKGVILHFHFTGRTQKKCSKGELEVKTFDYDGKHRYAVRCWDVPLKPRPEGKSTRTARTLGEFIDVILSNKMIPCAFNTENAVAVGCKDFISQLLYRLNEIGIIDIPQDSQQAFYDRFNYAYGRKQSETYADAVGYASFNTTYHNRRWVAIEHIKYRGNRINLDSARANEPGWLGSPSASEIVQETLMQTEEVMWVKWTTLY